MKSSQPLVDDRSAAFSRLAARVLSTLNDAVDHRKDEGETLTSIADRIGCNRSLLSRTLNGNSRNLTLRTIADILWATDFEPRDFAADPIESICQNWVRARDNSDDYDFVGVTVLPIREFAGVTLKEMGRGKVNFEIDEVAL